MHKQVQIRLNGEIVMVPEGSTILEAARMKGIYIPTLCYTPLLRPLENCRLCVVQVAGERQYKAACSTLVAEGMDIQTESEELRQTRRLLLELLLDTHYGDCVAPCTLACPANVDVQGYLALLRHGEYREAIRLIREKIPMPAIIGRVCPHPCEDACRRHLVEEPVAINGCKRFLADFELQLGEHIFPDLAPLSHYRVAIVGGGPVGLSAAYYLRVLGHQSTIFEARPKLGGMLRYGIPEYRLPKEVLDWEIEGILSLGVEVKTGVVWGRDFTLDDLEREGFDAIFLAVGAWNGRTLGIVGEDSPRVIPGVEYLEGIAGTSRKISVAGKKLVVIGGGNVAIDAARSALRHKAKEVTILYRRSRKEMPASHEEIEAAQREGVDIQFLAAPIQVSDTGEGPLRLTFMRMELGEPDASGRRRPVPVPGSERTMDIDLVISAVGQYPDIPSADLDGAVSSLPLTRWSTVGGDPQTMYTGSGNIFVGGDVFRGPATVVAAFADGRKAAYSMDRYFAVGEIHPEPRHFNISKGSLETIDREPFSVMRTISREIMAELDVSKRITTFEEVELGFTEIQARQEASRCLVCGCSAAFDCRLRELMNEFQVDWRDQPSKKIHYQHVAAADIHPFIALDPNKCIRCERCNVACSTRQCSDAIDLRDWPRLKENCVNCGLCVDICPTGALMEKREGRPVDRLDWTSVPTHCIQCGCGCRLELQLKGEHLVWIKDGSLSPPNWASTCEKGRFRTFDRLWFGNRIKVPLIRQGGNLKEVGWDEALSSVVKGFMEISEKYGGKAIGGYASPQASNEALYLLQRWVRTAWGSNVLDFPGRQARERTVDLIQKNYGNGFPFGELRSLDRADAIVVCGDNLNRIAPLVATMIRRAARTRKAPVLQLSTRPDDISLFASFTVHMQTESWPDLIGAFIRSVASLWGIPGDLIEKAGLSEKGYPVSSGIPQPGWDEWIRSFSSVSHLAFIFPDELAQSSAGDAVVSVLVRAASLAIHSNGSKKIEILPLSSHINASGALLMGVSPNRLPGFQPIFDSGIRERMATTWIAANLPQSPGPDLIEALHAGHIRGLLVQRAASLLEAEPEKWNTLLRVPYFLVVLENQISPATEFAQVILPAAAFGEYSGSVVNTENRLLPLHQAFSPPGEALPEWKIFAHLMAVQGVPYPLDMEAVRSEIKTLVPQFSGNTWDEFWNRQLL